MPELPEVETVRRGLAELIIGKTIAGTRVIDSPKSFPNDAVTVSEFMIGTRVTSVNRRAKVLLIELSSDYTLVIHLKMTGQLVFVAKEVDSKWKVEDSQSLKATFPTPISQPPTPSEAPLRFGAGHPNESLVGKLPDRSTRVVIKFSDGSQLFFNDQRKFGWVKLYPSPEVPNIDFMQKVGPEPLEDTFTAADFIARIRRRNGTSIKAAILDQTVLAGVGNIYADESLWSAKIHPATRVRDVTDTHLTLLLQSIKDVFTLSIEKGGSTDRNYVDAKGQKGSYLTFANVFRREGEPCNRCGTTLEKTKVAGRGTHVCPSCQAS